MKSSETSNQIITTIGPASASKEKIISLKKAGATSFRINLSHSNTNSLDIYYSLIKESGVLPSLDTQGAQIRISGSTPKSLYNKGDKVSITHYKSTSKEKNDILLNHSEIFTQIEVGDRLKIGFDGLVLEIYDIDKNNQRLHTFTINKGKISPNCAIDVSNKRLNLAPLTKFDIESITNYLDKGILEIYLSFTNKPDDILSLNSIINSVSVNLPKPKIIAKIETREGIANLNDILPIVDGILVDRGDLSREISISRIPIATYAIIDRCKSFNVPCYIATNILDSMITSSLPSRAEISDLFNLYTNGVSGIVLAAEVAIGANPVDCVHVVNYMHKLYTAQKNSFLSFLPDSSLMVNLPERLKHWL